MPIEAQPTDVTANSSDSNAPTTVKPTRRSALELLKRAVVALVLVSIFITTSVLLVLGGPALYYFDKHQSAIVLDRQAAGHALVVSLKSHWLATNSLVETDIGFYPLASPMTIRRDDVLTLERRANSDRYLCTSPNRCTRVLGN